MLSSDNHFLSNNEFFNDLRDSKPHIAISACLLGENVRYNGESKHFPYIKDYFSHNAILTSICPEVGAGLGVPRPPVQLIEIDDTTKALGVTDEQLDVTDALNNFSQTIQQKHKNEFQAVILKARSPSCGVSSTPIFNQQGKILRNDKGLFTQSLSQHWQHCIFIEEEDLVTETSRRKLLLRCYLLLDIKLTTDEQLPLLFKHYSQQFDQVNNKSQLTDFIINRSTTL